MFKLAIIFTLSLAYAAHADDDAVEKYRDFLPQQILALSEDERLGSVPMMFSSAANLAVSRHGNLVQQANLNSLFYQGFADFEGAKRAFQLDLGEASTGNLTVGQLQTLEYRASRINLTNVSFFPFNFGGNINDNFAVVRGTVELVDEKIAYPINHVKIECNRIRGTCEYNQIALTLPDANSWVQSYYIGEIADETYRVLRWEDQIIDAFPMTTNTCRTNQLSLNFATQEFFEIARNNASDECETILGQALPRLDKPRVARIVDGREIINAQFETINKEAYTFYSSYFRNRIDELTTEMDIE